MCLFDHFRLLNVVFKSLNSIKALSFIISHSVSGALMEHMANHGLVTLRIKFLVGSSGYAREFTGVRFEGVYTSFDVITEISHEFLSIFKNHHHRLIINWCPFTFLNWTPVNFSFNFVVIHETNLPNVLISKRELMILANYLNLIGKRVSTDFFGLEQVQLVSIFAQVELPHSVQRVSQAVNWLVCFDQKTQ
jgi:hypothetical protein